MARVAPLPNTSDTMARAGLAALLRAASSSAIDDEMIIKSATNGIRYANAPVLPTDRTTARACR